MRTCSADFRPLAVAAIVILAGCDRTDRAAEGTGRSAGAAASASRPAAGLPRTAAQPADACGWITAAEVEAIVGPLAGPPKRVRNGCLYPIPLDSATARRHRAAMKLTEIARDYEERFGPQTDSMIDRPPPETAVIVNVGLTQAALSRGLTAGFNRAAKDLGPRAGREPSTAGTAGPPAARQPPDGWDRFLPKLSFLFPELALGVGHLDVRIVRQTPAVTAEQALALADRIRQRLPDLPFQSDVPFRTGIEGAAADRDPCSLLGAPEAEAILGKLAVSPYRAEESSYLAQGDGPSCAYFTAGHRALVLTPVWEYGAMEFEAMRGMGGLLGEITPELLESPADTLDEEWQEVGADAATGELHFLEGERLLKVGYLSSSTDANGAVQLARLAMRRLTAEPAGHR